MPPFPGIPYGPAPHWTYIADEVSSYILLALCLVHAARRGHAALGYLFGGLTFGLILEYFEVLGHSYTYGRFTLMLGHAPLDIPFCIGCGWAIILYSSRLFSDSFRLPMLSAAALDVLLALNIDLSLDVVAYRLHMWHWHWEGSGLNPLTAQWFGIPYGNFIGWATVVFGFSFFSRLFERKLAPSNNASPIRTVAITIASLLAAMALLVVTETTTFKHTIRSIGINSARELILIIVLCLALTAFGFTRRTRATLHLPALAAWVPTWFHAFCIAMFFALGFYRENRAMTLIACANVALGLVIHFYPWKQTAASTATESIPLTDAVV